jgi:hypothetical protein
MKSPFALLRRVLGAARAAAGERDQQHQAKHKERRQQNPCYASARRI